MKINHQNYFIILLLSFAFANNANAQTCKDDKEIQEMPGKLILHTETPVGGPVSSYSFAEKAKGNKVLSAIEEICKKYYYLTGGVAKGSFGYLPKNYGAQYFHGTYRYILGFYGNHCINGNVKAAHEYGTELQVTVNPVIGTYYSPSDIRIPGASTADLSNDFKKVQKDYKTPYLTIFQYIVFRNDEEMKNITGEKTMLEDLGGAKDADHTANGERTWYFALPGKKMFSEVSRKEFLESLAEYYEREKKVLGEQIQTKLQNLKNPSAYSRPGSAKNIAYMDSLANNIQQQYAAKKSAVSKLLAEKDANWLKQTVVVKPEYRSYDWTSDSPDAERKLGYLSISKFYEGADGVKMYKLNPDYFTTKLSSPMSPILIKAYFRFNGYYDFSQGVRDNMMKKMDMNEFGKLLEN